MKKIIMNRLTVMMKEKTMAMMMIAAKKIMTVMKKVIMKGLMVILEVKILTMKK
jgi:hypothetical protein